MTLTLDQIIASAIPFTTSVGADYKLPRLSLRTRKPVLTFMAKVQALEAEGEDLEQVSVLIPLMDDLVTMLQEWLSKIYPDLTREQIEDEWDISDIPKLMQIIGGTEKEIQDILPPPLPEETPVEIQTGEISPVPSAKGSQRIK